MPAQLAGPRSSLVPVHGGATQTVLPRPPFGVQWRMPRISPAGSPPLSMQLGRAGGHRLYPRRAPPSCTQASVAEFRRQTLALDEPQSSAAALSSRPLSAVNASVSREHGQTPARDDGGRPRRSSARYRYLRVAATSQPGPGADGRAAGSCRRRAYLPACAPRRRAPAPRSPRARNGARSPPLCQAPCAAAIRHRPERTAADDGRPPATSHRHTSDRPPHQSASDADDRGNGCRGGDRPGRA